MNRLSFIKGLAGLVIGSRLPGHLSRSYQKMYLCQCFVAGFQFGEGPERLSVMQEGDLLELKREPDNAEDSRAIMLLHNGVKIGYVPRRENKTLSRLLDAAVIPLVAEITHIRKNVATWENVRIAIYTLKELSGPVPNHAEYLTRVGSPAYRSKEMSINRRRSRRDWHEHLVSQSKTDHIYDLIYNNLYPGFGGPNHDGDFVVIRESRMPSYFRDVYTADVTGYLPDIEAPFGKKDYMAMASDRLGNYLEAARKMKEVYDNKGNNFIELLF